MLIGLLAMASRGCVVHTAEDGLSLAASRDIVSLLCRALVVRPLYVTVSHHHIDAR